LVAKSQDTAFCKPGGFTLLEKQERSKKFAIDKQSGDLRDESTRSSAYPKSTHNASPKSSGDKMWRQEKGEGANAATVLIISVIIIIIMSLLNE